jgi:signal transduction histidine kinase
MGAPPREPPPPLAPGGEDNDLLQNTVSRVVLACDIVFGTTTSAFAVLGVWLFVLGEVRFATIAALWWLPLYNAVWSALTKRRDRVIADLIRGVISLPSAVFVYVAEHGVFERLWIPALVMSMGIALSVCIASRRSLPGQLVALVYAGALLTAAIVRFGTCDLATVADVVGIAVIGIVTSVVGSKLGRLLDEARRQRDGVREQKERAEGALEQLTKRSVELTKAIESLRLEMEHRMRVEVELRQAQKLEAVGRLAAGVAHEINTPVQFVRDSIQFVRDGVSDLFGAVDKLEVVHASVPDLPYLVDNVPKAMDLALDGLHRVATIVRSMKEFAHPDSAQMEPADLNHAIENTLTIARNEYKDVAEVETELGDLPRVRCHIGELNQALLNIIINAAHAIADVVQGTNTRGCIRVRTVRDGGDVVITVADTGGGIPEAIRNRVFDPFFTTKDVGRGSGQGLAIAHSVIVGKHHGRLGFETEPGRGTTFSIRIPIDGDAAGEASAA